MLGAHLSISGGLYRALERAKELGCDCVQIFTRNQQQWAARPISREEFALWRDARKRLRSGPAVSHGSYLVNLASPDETLWLKSMSAFREELVRCHALGIECAVIHPGAHIGGGEEAGLVRTAEALRRVYASLPKVKVTTCLEITAGQGSGIGWRLEHLREIIELAGLGERLAVCLDTAHMLAGGYDLTSAEGAKAVLAEADAVVGLERVRVIHLNDSKGGLGSRVDRHEHIGHGKVALEAFGVIVNHPAFRRVPMVIETPKDIALDGRHWDVVNLETLRKLLKTPRKKARPVT